LEFKDKIKVVGVARQQLLFLCSDKENEAKLGVRVIDIGLPMSLTSTLALRWACLVRQGSNIDSGCSNRSKVQVSRVGDEALESLSICGGLLLWACFSGFSLVSHTAREAPL
jgi:hypothetical protein